MPGLGRAILSELLKNDSLSATALACALELCESSIFIRGDAPAVAVVLCRIAARNVFLRAALKRYSGASLE